MAYLLDGGVILILALAIWAGMRRGLVRSIVLMGGSIIAIVLASTFSRPAADAIFDGFVRDRLVTAAETRLSTSAITGAQEKAVAILEELPDPIANLLRSQPGDGSGSIEAVIRGKAEATARQLAETAVDTAVRPLAISLLNSICFVVIFLLLMIVVHLLASLVNRIFRLPVLKQFNQVGGAVVGALQGGLVIILYVAVLQVIASSGSPEAAISVEAIENTMLVSRIVSYLRDTAVFGSAFQVLSKVM